MENNSTNTQLLKNPISFADLIDEGAQFEVDSADVNSMVYDDFCCDNTDNDETVGDIKNEDLVSPWIRPFSELRMLMQCISEHIYKRVVREGNTELGLVPNKARVALRYSAYWEGEGAPFDSSLLRGTKYEFETGQDEVVVGLEAAVRTMYPYEQAEFIISYKLLFLELGCPPRIRPRADGLFKIEVLSFALVGNVQALEQIQPEDKDKFVVIYPKAKEIQLHGKDCVKRGAFHNAISAFERAISALNYCRTSDIHEESKQTELLVTLYTNLMICYNKLNKPQRVCIMMKAIRRLTMDQPSCKALFQEGRALVALGEYKCGRQAFLQAQAKQPNNTEISAEIINVDKRILKYQRDSSEIWSRALRTKEEILSSEKKQNNCALDNIGVKPQIKNEFDKILKDFSKAPLKSLSLARHMFTEKEFRVLRQLALENNMSLNLSPIDKNRLTLQKF
ncbi:inactive peptidyl-prolyl cis-trans isomerase shutdown [Scaptodrosophila lebanonensis]|uniref:peptidylprolyl isomerase n=1 Tax=Drosophila lebanonensis TaxID=7225 RepID=A0A6J2TY05_DROLE|nr:inactive peptidyl-prolyl cis-trans isomerase shutdown [Scaptodrosophila lebanonensis]